MLPEAKYTFEIIDVQNAESRAGNPMLVVVVRVVSEPLYLLEYRGYEMSQNYPLQSSALWRLNRLLIACGIPAKDRLGNGKLKASELMGKRFIADIVHVDHVDVMTARARTYANLANERTSSEPEDLDDEELFEEFTKAEREAQEQMSRADKLRKEIARRG